MGHEGALPRAIEFWGAGCVCDPGGTVLARCAYDREDTVVIPRGLLPRHRCGCREEKPEYLATLVARVVDKIKAKSVTIGGTLSLSTFASDFEDSLHRDAGQTRYHLR